MVEWEPTEYTPNETARLVADPELQRDLHAFSIWAVARIACVSENTVKAARRGERLRKSTIEKLKRAIRELRDRCAHVNVDRDGLIDGWATLR